jgi:hypothetical protein
MKKSQNKCVFCGSIANTKEDIFPKWLQRHFKLNDQELNLLNKTPIKYSQLKVPACHRCNTQIFSNLENKIKRQKATNLEYFIWMLKIFIGILYEESLLINYKTRNLRSIYSKRLIKEKLRFARNIFKVYINKGAFGPIFPGSLLIIDTSNYETDFDYVDILFTPISGIVLPKRILVFLPFDRGLASNFNHAKFPKLKSAFRFRKFVAEVGHYVYRFDINYHWINFKDSTFFVVPSLSTPTQQPYKKSQLIRFYNYVGISSHKMGDKYFLSLNKK